MTTFTITAPVVPYFLLVTLACVSGNITFYRKVSSESGCDYLRFYIDGVEKGDWSGEEDWGEASFSVTEGTRTFEWTYSKDGSVSEGDDTAWIDDIAFPVNCDGEPPIHDRHLVGWWKLDEGAGSTVADASGRGHNGVFAEGIPEWVEGIHGKALRFDGASEVSIPDHADFHMEDAVSAALWAQPESDQPNYAKLFIKQKSVEYPYALQYDTSQQIYAMVNASARFNTNPRVRNFPGEWAHLCFTYDGTALILYKDGEEVGQIAASGKLQQNNLSLSIGGRLDSDQDYIGVIDDVRLYNRALTQEEVEQIMTGVSFLIE